MSSTTVSLSRLALSDVLATGSTVSIQLRSLLAQQDRRRYSTQSLEYFPLRSASFLQSAEGVTVLYCHTFKPTEWEQYSLRPLRLVGYCSL